MDSEVFNMVTVSAIKFADATSDGSKPSTLKSIGVLSEAKFNPNFDPGTSTPEYNELTGNAFRVYRGKASNKFSIDLPKLPIEDYATFLGCDYDQAKKALKIGGGYNIPKQQYFEVYGTNTIGVPVVLIGYSCDIVAKWSGSVGAAQATVPVSVEATLLEDNSPEPQVMYYGPVSLM